MKERKIVISSITGKPIPWEDPETDGAEGRAAPEPDVEESNDARIAADVPPHWGRGQ